MYKPDQQKYKYEDKDINRTWYPNNHRDQEAMFEEMHTFQDAKLKKAVILDVGGER